MSSYSPSTIARVADINRGMIVSTAVLDATAACVSTAKNLFTVRGLIRILMLEMEVITALGADATTIQFHFDPSTPAIAAVAFSAVSASVASIEQGHTVMLSGTALNTAPLVSAEACVGLSNNAWIQVGCTDGVGVITSTGGTADATSGTVKFHLAYVPITDGAYAEAA